MPRVYVVKEGEHFSQIARAHGFRDHRTLYDHPRNRELKQQRPDPNVLHAGDEIFVPDLELKDVDLAVDKTEHEIRLSIGALNPIDETDDTLRSGADAGRQHVIESPVLSIGSADGNVVVVRDGTVSRRHCEIVLRDHRRILRDLRSTNGTFLNGVEVIEAVLPDRAKLRLGDIAIDYESSTRTERVHASDEARFGELFGASDIMRRTFTLLARIAPTPLSCLILGETGTGKDLAARSLHAASLRSEGPFVVFDCAGMQRNLIESQVFGHERGAFTGAEKQYRGVFEQAHGGTLLLDEIGELPLDMQPRLLSALERREVTRLGGSKPIEVNVRVIAATHRDLAAMVCTGSFREDLFYRLAEMIVRLPPLRDRLEDIPLIAGRLLRASFADPAPRVTDAGLGVLGGQRWPGNIRELRNLLRRAAAFADGPEIDVRALHTAMEHAIAVPTASVGSSEPRVELCAELPLKSAREQWTRELETKYLAEVLARFGEDLDTAAVHVGVHRKSYMRLLRERGLRDD